MQQSCRSGENVSFAGREPRKRLVAGRGNWFVQRGNGLYICRDYEPWSGSAVAVKNVALVMVGVRVEHTTASRPSPM